MRLKTLYLRFYKSFNYDYLRKTAPGAVPDPWDLLPDDDLFYPFVSIDIESSVTTVVGANESGKSQTISAVKSLLTGARIEREDFCRYSAFFAVNKAMAVPEFGGHFCALSDADAHTVRGLAGLPADHPVTSFCFFRFNRGVVLYVLKEGTWEAKELTPSDAKKLVFPTWFEIDSDVPLPESIPLDYLAGNKARPPLTRSAWLDRQEALRGSDALFKTPDSIQKGAARLFSLFGPTVAEPEHDPKVEKSLKLAEDLLLRVAGIHRTAFQELQKAVRGAEGYANGLVDKMNEQLANALNFPKWWSQDSDFGLYLTLRDFDLVLTVRDRTGSDYSFGERSGGMQYFLSYFVQYLAHEPVAVDELLLMDEPDAFLSTQGQQDLLRIFRAFTEPEDPKRNPVQVLYVTHSPFLIDKNHGERIRVLEKGDGEEGTRVVRNASKNHYEPLRSAFGSFVAETTFIGHCNLMVEGAADQVLLAGMSSLSRRAGATAEVLDLNDLTIVPAGSASQIPYLVYLALGRDVDRPAVIVLLDSDKSGKASAAHLNRDYRGKQLIDPKFVLTLDMLPTAELKLATEKVEEIEDLIPVEAARLGVIRFANEVLTPEAASAFAARLTSISVDGAQTLHEAAQAAATAASPDSSRPLTLDKIGLARGVLDALAADASEGLRDECLANFHVLFRELGVRRRAALRENQRDRITKTLRRLRDAFLKDHKTTATRLQVTELLESIEDQLVDASAEAEGVRKSVREMRDRFELAREPLEPVADFDGFCSALAALSYEPVREAQSG